MSVIGSLNPSIPSSLVTPDGQVFHNVQWEYSVSPLDEIGRTIYGSRAFFRFVFSTLKPRSNPDPTLAAEARWKANGGTLH